MNRSQLGTLPSETTANSAWTLAGVMLLRKWSRLTWILLAFVIILSTLPALQLLIDFGPKSREPGPYGRVVVWCEIQTVVAVAALYLGMIIARAELFSTQFGQLVQLAHDPRRLFRGYSVQPILGTVIVFVMFMPGNAAVSVTVGVPLWQWALFSMVGGSGVVFAGGLMFLVDSYWQRSRMLRFVVLSAFPVAMTAMLAGSALSRQPEVAAYFDSLSDAGLRVLRTFEGRTLAQVVVLAGVSFLACIGGLLMTWAAELRFLDYRANNGDGITDLTREAASPNARRTGRLRHSRPSRPLLTDLPFLEHRLREGWYVVAIPLFHFVAWFVLSLVELEGETWFERPETLAAIFAFLMFMLAMYFPLCTIFVGCPLAVASTPSREASGKTLESLVLATPVRRWLYQVIAADSLIGLTAIASTYAFYAASREVIPAAPKFADAALRGVLGISAAVWIAAVGLAVELRFAHIPNGYRVLISAGMLLTFPITVFLLPKMLKRGFDALDGEPSRFCDLLEDVQNVLGGR